MNPTEWAEARALWETGEVTLQELAVRFGVTERALQAHFKKSSIVKGCKAKEMAAAVQQAVFADIFEDPAITRAKEREARAAAYENATKIEKLIMGQLAEAQKDPANAHRASSALRALATSDTAGLKCPPEIGASVKIRTTRMAPVGSLLPRRRWPPSAGFARIAGELVVDPAGRRAATA